MEESPPLLGEQLAYYRAVAGEYHTHALDLPGQQELADAIRSWAPEGDALELACGTGLWTEQLTRTATTVTAVDGAPEMLALARARVGPGAPVRFVEADLFSWRPDRRYDAVWFGFWISHVPEERFEPFWRMVADAMAPGGRVFFFDDNHRTDEELIDGPDSPIVERRLHDGRPFRVVKIPYQPDQLEQRLRALGWDVAVAGSGPFYWGSGGLAA
ncbi:MAG: class I SAM-dependent methyltransferase [Acidimicrobiales bacterium]